jgi:hypothetical protein
MPATLDETVEQVGNERCSQYCEREIPDHTQVYQVASRDLDRGETREPPANNIPGT